MLFGGCQQARQGRLVLTTKGFLGACAAFCAAICTTAALAAQSEPPAPPASAPPAQGDPAAGPVQHVPFTARETVAKPVEPLPPAKDLLSTVWLQRALAMVADQDISGEGLAAMLEVAQQCGTLTPNRPAPWRIVMYLSDQLELTRPDLVVPARRAALANLARLEPNNDSITLARLTDAVEANGTAEERVRAYERLLDESNAKRLGAPIRGRLAYQLAMLQNRMGNVELFARWLGESVKIDPSYPPAALAAAGFFRSRVDDPAADVQLLSIAVTANPRDLSTWSSLLTVLLDGGAFKSAERVARDALVVATEERQWPAINNLTSDLATAMWGQGRRDEARRELRNRLSVIADDYRRMIQYQDNTLTADRIKALFPPLPPSLCITALALADPVQDAKEYDRIVGQALMLTEAESTEMKKSGIGSRLPDLLDKAAISLLFSKEPQEVELLLTEIRKDNLLTPAALARFEGLMKWRTHKLDEAIAELAPLREGDALAHFGYASALVEAGRVQEGAREWHALAKNNVGTAIGLMALDKLSAILNKERLLTTQLSKDIADRAALLDQSLADNLPTLVDEILVHPNRALAVTARLVTNDAGDVAGPFRFLGVKVTIRNTTKLPFSIGRHDPLFSQLVMRAELNSTRSTAKNTTSSGGEVERAVPQATIPFDQGLQLAPDETIEFIIDTANTPLGANLARFPLVTTLVTMSVVTNPHETGYGAMPGLLGGTFTVTPTVVTGIRVTKDWVEEGLKDIAGPPTVDTVVQLALLLHAAATPDPAAAPATTTPASTTTAPAPTPTTAPATAAPPAADAQWQAARAAMQAPEFWKAIVAAWSQLDATEQAWLLAVLPPDFPAMTPLIEAARSSASPEVLTTWLLCRVTDPKDPMLDVARRTGDPLLIRLADNAAWVADRRQKRTIEELGVGDRPQIKRSGVR